jgi:hypothetical protein
MSRAAHLKKPRRGFFALRTIGGPMLFESTRPMSLALSQNKNLSVLSYVEVFLVGAGGFEPPKLKAADLQSVPIGHSGTRPYSLFVSFAGRLAYFIMKEGFCQLFFTFFFKCIFRAEKRLSKGGKSPAATQARQSRRKKPAGRN